MSSIATRNERRNAELTDQQTSPNLGTKKKMKKEQSLRNLWSNSKRLTHVSMETQKERREQLEHENI